MARLKAAVVRWRGGVRYGGATVVVRGRVERVAGPEGKSGPVLLRAAGTNQRFQLRSGSAGPDPAAFPAGELLRVTGRVVKGSEGSEHEICLELERVDPDARTK